MASPPQHADDEMVDVSRVAEPEVDAAMADADPDTQSPEGRKRKRMTKRSEVWEHFSPFLSGGGKQRARCNYCKKDLAADPNLNGTSSLKTHLLSCKKFCGSSNTQTMLRFSHGSNQELGTWRFDNDIVKRKLAEMIMIDENPFSLVEKDGFRKFCEVALPPSFKIPSRRTITKLCFNIYIEERTKLQSFFKRTKQRISITTDTWTSLQRVTYMSLTAHFIDDSWKLNKKILNLVPVESHKGEDLGDAVERCLKDWGIERVYALTVDNASSNDGVVRVLRNALNRWGTAVRGGQDLHMRCAAHIINLVVGEGTKEKDIHGSINSVRAAVKFVRQSPLRLRKFKECAEFEGIPSRKWLCLDVPTRWNSMYLMLNTAEKFERAFERYSRQERDIRIELNKEGAPGFPSCLDWENVRRVVKFLQHFFYLTEKVSGTQYTTTNLYLPELSEVDYKLQEWEKDADAMDMATKMREKYLKYWGDPMQMNKNIFHAVVLDPRHKMEFLQFILIKMFGDEKGKEYGDMVRSELTKLFDEYRKMGSAASIFGEASSSSTMSSGFAIGASTEAEPSQDGVMHQLKSAFKRYKAASGQNSERTELEKYLAEETEDDALDFDVLGWWKMNSHRFPTISAMARDVLAVPISTVASEAAFSTGGRVLDSFRSSLTPRMAQALVCGQDWLRAKAKSAFDDEDLDQLQSLENELDKLHLDSTILD